MELEVGARTDAVYGEKSSERLVKRNGYRERNRQMRAGSVELGTPSNLQELAVLLLDDRPHA